MPAPAAPAAIRQSMGLVEWAMLVSLSILWGGAFFFVGVVVDALPTLTIVALRVGLAAVALWAFAFALGRRVPTQPAVILAFLIMGLLNNVAPFTLIVWGQQSIGSGLASILNATTPLFSVIVAGALLSDEQLTGLKGLGAFVGFAGVAAMIGVGALAGVEDGVLAQLAILGAALSYAFAGAFGRRFRTLGVDPIMTAAGQVTASTLILAPIAIWTERPFSLPAPGLEIWAAVFALAVPGTALAYVLYFEILRRAGATNVLLVTLLVPVSAILLGALFLGERLGWSHALGFALIGLGLSLIDGRLWRRRSAPA